MTDQNATSVAPATFPDLGPGAEPSRPRSLDRLADVELDITVELGRAHMRMRDLLSLGEGSVVELDRSADTPVDILANGRLIARGEVVVVGDELGVRVTDLVDA